MINEQLKSKTVSEIFYLPLLRIGRDRLDRVQFVTSYLINGESDVVYENALYLLFQPKSMESFNDFLAAERERGAIIINEEDYPEGYILVTYQLSDEFEEDYKKLWKGQYSLTSKKYQTAIPSVIQYRHNGMVVKDMSAQHMIFTKYQPLKDFWEEEFNTAFEDWQELWAKPTVEKETFKIEKYVKPVTESSKRVVQ